MLNFTIRRLMFAVPTLLVISFIIFAILDLAPNDPTGNLPLTIPPEVKQKIRESLGLGQPFHIRYLKWLVQFFINEPLNILEEMTGWVIGDSENRLRVVSWATRSPVVDLIVQRMPQTLWVVGMSYVVGILIAVPIGVISAYKQYSWFDQIGTFISMVGFSVPTFFTGVLLIVIFSTMVPTDSWFWLPSIYDTTLEVTDWPSFMLQVRQMIMPVMVLALFNAAQISRFMRASMLDNLSQDYVRTARAKGLKERVVLLVHVLRNSMIPVITVIALGIPQIFGGAIITEQIFRVNGLGQLLIIGIQGADIPLVQTLTFIFAVLIVFFNLIADILYGILDPRIRYD
jgi:peptide/nickel transport system permease protein